MLDWARAAPFKAGSTAVSESASTAGESVGDYQVARFSTADYSPRERVDACREVYGRVLSRRDIEPLSTEEFHTEATLRRMPGLGLMAARRSAAVYRLRPETIDNDDIVIVAALTSGYQAHQLGRTLDLGPGEAIVLTMSEPEFVMVPRCGDYIGVRAPERALSPLVPDLGSAYGRAIPADNAALKLLSRYVGALGETETFAATDLRPRAVTHIHDLMALTIGATRDSAEVAKKRGARAARLLSIKEDISDILNKADLSVAEIAARHGVTPRHVQRLFEDEGTTFTEYLLGQRLAFAHRLLTSPHAAGLKISAIAFDAGFGELSYFNRAFRRRYGATPSELRGG
jgi:AraC-like DNA-binding protein